MPVYHSILVTVAAPYRRVQLIESIQLETIYMNRSWICEQVRFPRRHNMGYLSALRALRWYSDSVQINVRTPPNKVTIIYRIYLRGKISLLTMQRFYFGKIPIWELKDKGDLRSQLSRQSNGLLIRGSWVRVPKGVH